MNNFESDLRSFNVPKDEVLAIAEQLLAELNEAAQNVEKSNYDLAA